VAPFVVGSYIDIRQLNLPALPLRWKSRGAIIRPSDLIHQMHDASEIPEIRRFLDGLRRKLKAPESVAVPAPDDKSAAAVLVPLMRRDDGGLDVLYTRRSDRLASHRGQVAFPGGRFDRRDTSLLASALRETHEEVGIAPDQIRVIGTFPGRRTMATNISVTPFVGIVEGDPILTPDPKEVADIFRVPLEALSDPRYRSSYRWKRPGQSTESDYPAIHYGGQVIWGLTYSFTQTFLELIHDRDSIRRHRHPPLTNSK
jgi:8-oxo-dGTP pyrophosphatase MutT (NUDIX family)